MKNYAIPKGTRLKKHEVESPKIYFWTIRYASLPKRGPHLTVKSKTPQKIFFLRVALCGEGRGAQYLGLKQRCDLHSPAHQVHLTYDLGPKSIRTTHLLSIWLRNPNSSSPSLRLGRGALQILS